MKQPTHERSYVEPRFVERATRSSRVRTDETPLASRNGSVPPWLTPR